MARFLLKTEPGEYSFDDLERERYTAWNGVSNALALKNLRDVKEGDDLIIYHTGDERQAVGLARVIRGPYSGVEASGVKAAEAEAGEDDEGETKASSVKPKDSKSVQIDVIVGKRFPRPVSLSEIKDNPAFADFDLLRLPRLSVVPVSEKHWTEILRLAGALSRR